MSELTVLGPVPQLLGDVVLLQAENRIRLADTLLRIVRVQVALLLLLVAELAVQAGMRVVGVWSVSGLLVLVAAVVLGVLFVRVLAVCVLAAGWLAGRFGGWSPRWVGRRFRGGSRVCCGWH
ncbi:hypothetical protein [Streptomyces sp. NPDC093591]|uniref:hypothetical protein n=1 Tax=Streptomyces sp. NPDC093591 TaxID=3366044 RepID=UPI00380D0090